MYTRDSLFWWLAIVGALIAFLLSAPPPDQWTYYQWLQLLAFIVSTVSGKLASSPLPSKEDKRWENLRTDRRFRD